MFHAGSASNVIPDTASIKLPYILGIGGMVRCLTEGFGEESK